MTDLLDATAAPMPEQGMAPPGGGASDMLAQILAAADGADKERADPPPRDALPNMSREAEMELVGHVRDLFLKARSKRRPLVEQWNRNYRMLRTRRSMDRSRGWAPRSEVPEIWPVADTLVAWITDQTPSFDAAPVVPPTHPMFDQMGELAQDLKVVMEANWWVDRNDAEVEKVAWDGITYGLGWFKTVWDGTAGHGQGNAVQRRRDPYAVYWDTEASSMENVNYIIDAANISEQELERRFPGALKRINDAAWSEQIDQQPSVLDQAGTSMPKANPGAIAPAVSPRYGLPGQSREHVSDAPGVTLFEAWLRTPKTDDDGNTYDCWRCVCVASNRVLMDCMAEDLWSHGQHPFDRYVPIETGEFCGTSMVEMLSPMQESINGLLRAMEHNIWLNGNPVLKEDTRAGLSRTAVTNKPGQRLTVNSGGSIDWMTPPNMPADAKELIRFYVDEMERVSGLSAVVRGATPSGRNAQGVIDSVQEAAFVRLRKNRRNLSMTIGAAGEKAAAMVVEFYDTPRVVSMLGPSGETTIKELKTDHFYVPGPDGQRQPMRFRLLIDGGERASQSRGQRISEADALYAMGAIDEEALLKIHELPGWPNIVQRVREMKAQTGQIGQPPTQRAAARR